MTIQIDLPPPHSRPTPARPNLPCPDLTCPPICQTHGKYCWASPKGHFSYRAFTLALENAGGRQGNTGLTPLSAPLPTPVFEESWH